MPGVSVVLPGTHRVRKRSAGRVTEYWYAWRGGPQILKVTAASDAALDTAVALAAGDAVIRYKEVRRPTDKATLYGLITRYLESPEFGQKAPRTQKDRRKLLDFVRNELGHWELLALKAKGARTALLDWRLKYASTPKTADERLNALSVVLTWATERGEIDKNPVENFPRLYRSNRAEAIWEPQHLAKLYPKCEEETKHAVRLAALTGLRLGDLIKLPWSAVGENAIVWQTGKSRGRKTVVIPITPDLKALLKEIPRRDSVTVLNSSRKRPWSEPGLESALRRAKIAAGIEGLRFHDLRGTAATNFVRAGLSLADVATVLGWKKARVEEIAARYVSAEAIGLALVERMRKNASGPKM
ncbi:MAG: tyrosine-type recombinase/integrase [Ignavibacteriales bacterium]